MNPELEVAVTPPVLIAARRVLLDALDALAPHHDALVLVGAQALYLQTQDAGADLVVAAYTTDGDLAVNLRILAGEPHLEQALREADFELWQPDPGRVEPGIWVRSTLVQGLQFDVPVDLLVPSQQLTGSRRSAAPPPHDRTAARRIDGLDAALIDCAPMTLAALEPDDPREHSINVAGPAALLIGKITKIDERLTQLSQGRDRLKGGKDAADIFRLMRTHDTDALAARFTELAAHEDLAPVVENALRVLSSRFATVRAAGTDLAVQSLTAAVPEDEVRTLCAAWTNALVSAYRA